MRELKWQVMLETASTTLERASLRHSFGFGPDAIRFSKLTTFERPFQPLIQVCTHAEAAAPVRNHSVQLFAGLVMVRQCSEAGSRAQRSSFREVERKHLAVSVGCDLGGLARVHGISFKAVDVLRVVLNPQMSIWF